MNFVQNAPKQLQCLNNYLKKKKKKLVLIIYYKTSLKIHNLDLRLLS